MLDKIDPPNQGLLPARLAARRSLRLGLVCLLSAAVAALPQIGASPSTAVVAPALISASSAPSAEAEFVRLLNDVRQSHGKGTLVVNSDIGNGSRSWSSAMRGDGTLRHDPNLRNVMDMTVPSWRRIGENVGVGYSVQSLHDAFWNSSGHRANMLGDYNQVGIGVVYEGGGRLWVTVRFAQAPLPKVEAAPAPTRRPDRIGIRRSNAQHLRTSLSAGPAEVTFGYGTTDDVVVTGDWDGDGVATPGVFRNGTWYLRNGNSSGPADLSFGFGRHGDIPLVGDWDGNGTDTIGVWRSGQFFLRDANSSGPASASFTYGRATDVPLTGDWDGNRSDTVGVRRGNTFYLRNSNSGGGAGITFSYGWASDAAVVGAW